MAERPILFVAGLGRCGTTLVMNMLARGGMPCSGPAPAYETRRLSHREVDLPWVRAQAGRAVKWLDPHKVQILAHHLPTRPVIICLARDPQHQARSQIKMAAAFGMPVISDRRTIRAMAASLRDEQIEIERLLDRLGDCYHLSFEWILGNPWAAAQKLCAIIADKDLAPGFVAERAAEIVLPRSPHCAPDLSIEQRMKAHG